MAKLTSVGTQFCELTHIQLGLSQLEYRTVLSSPKASLYAIPLQSVAPDQEAHTPGSSFLYGWDSRSPMRTGVGTGRQKTSRMCGQMWDSWWLCGLRTTHFTAADGDHWWNPSRDFAEQPPHKPLGTTTLVLQEEVSRSPPCPLTAAFQNFRMTFLTFILSSCPSFV